ncbi:class I SAM-dependent methyltransferase [Nonomuraea sp. NPDC048826]|uniref:class I SAM-dependent methyltransferase n=1 Tax=Nonomuraea sp. NPDC048826 TaxID=3364347 RepID=UPI00372245C9
MEYPFEDRRAEEARLVAQGRLFDPLTRRLLADAGLTPGMRVLDLGSGAGNVALIAAGLVGPEGRVVGVERDPVAVERARRLAAEAGVANVEFREGDVTTLEGVEPGFDAVVGRLVLMYLADPAGALRRAAGRLRPGGVLCLHEADLDYLWAYPRTPLWEQLRGWLFQTLEKAGVRRRMGLELYGAFRAAGLPAPRLTFEAVAGGGPEAPAWGWAWFVGGLAPLMARLGVATVAEVGPETLADRLLAELTAEDGYVIGPPLVGAWAVVPGE